MKPVKILWNHLAGNRLLYLGALLSVGFGALATILGPLVIRLTIDSIIGDTPLTIPLVFMPLAEQAKKSLLIPGLVLVGLTILRGFFIFLRGRLAATASDSIAKNLRDQVFDHIQHLPFSYHKQVDTGDLLQRCTSDIDTIRRFLGQQLVEVGNALFMIVLISTIMFKANPRMTFYSMLVVPVIFAFALIFFRKVKTAFREADEAEAEMTTVLQENLTGIRVVRAFNNQAYELERFTAKNEVNRDKLYHLIWLLACYWSASDFLAFFQIGLVLVSSAYFTSKGVISMGTMVLFTSYVGMILWPVRQLGRILTDMGKALVAVERLEEIFTVEKEDLVVTNEQPRLSGAITFQNVSFGYEPNQLIIQDISFQVQPGQTVAILGHTGSGKSSLVHLLARLYDYDSGSITLDGHELKSLDKSWVRRQVAVVPQEPFLFAKTIRDNITLARGQVTDEELYEVCQQAAVHDVIMDFDQGYDTLVGERGVSVSGGQRQRIAIARALITKSPILIFDDSLSAVDTETDLAIRNALQARAKRATTFLISHRVTSLADADLILVLKQGQIVERGTHEELLAKQGVYYQVWEMQNSLESALRPE